MTVLAGDELLRRLTDEDPARRLVVGPLLEPMEQIKKVQASIDIRLGCDFRLASAANIGVLDQFAPPSMNHFADLAAVYQHFYVPLGGDVTIHPHQMMLAMTLEYLRLPSDLIAYVIGRSTLGRLGLIVATAIGVHPRFYGPLTLEIRNLGEAPIRLYPGQTIGQLFFHTIESISYDDAFWSDTNQVSDQYSGTTDPIPRQISSTLTRTHLDKLRRDHQEGWAKLHSRLIT
ncbi:MAG: dCTP deaminase [Acetobacteraceae bacterium]|nr:dCTP deaminase [Acetobacteraceae bacterium]